MEDSDEAANGDESQWSSFAAQREKSECYWRPWMQGLVVDVSYNVVKDEVICGVLSTLACSSFPSLKLLLVHCVLIANLNTSFSPRRHPANLITSFTLP